MKSLRKPLWELLCIFTLFLLPALSAKESMNAVLNSFLTTDTEYIILLDFRKLMKTPAAKKMLDCMKEQYPGKAKDLQKSSDKIQWAVIAGKGDNAAYIMETSYVREELLQTLQKHVPDLSMKKIGKYQVYTGTVSQNLYIPEICYLSWISPSGIALYSGKVAQRKFFMDCLISNRKGIPSDLKPVLKKSNPQVFACGGISMKSVYKNISKIIPAAQNIRGARFELLQTPAGEFLFKSETVTADPNTASMLAMILQQYKILFSGMLQDESMMKMTPQERAKKLDQMVQIRFGGNSVKVVIRLPQNTVYSLTKEIFCSLGFIPGNQALPQGTAGTNTNIK